MSLNHYVSVGRSGLRVSPFCLGTMTFGNEWGFGADEATSAQILDFYLEQGGNFVDTANIYNKSHSETILGGYFSRVPGKRHRIVLATKFSGNMHPGDPNSGGGSRKAIIAACEASLERLKTDYIDLYWQHFEDPLTPMEETMRALNDLVASGKVRYVGLSDTPAWKAATAQVIAQFRGWSPLAALQVEYSLLERTIEGEHIPMAQAHGLGVMTWGPLRSGILSGKYSRNNMKAESAGRAYAFVRDENEKTYELLDVLAAVAKRHNTSSARVALAWVRSRPGVTAPILGARTLDQLKDNLAAFDVRLEPEDMAELDAASTPKLNFPAAIIQGAYGSMYPGITINGRLYGVSPMGTKTK